jgi:hypothetical protein
MYEKIKKWYRQGLWTAEMVQDAVDRGILAEDEYKTIVEVDAHE